MSLSEMTTKDKTAPYLPTSISWRQHIKAVVVLFKLRVVSLLLLAAVGGAFLGAQGWPGLGHLTLVLITGGMAAAGASALNQYIERHSDHLMGRTRTRPLVTGQFQAQPVLLIAITLVLLPSLAVLPINPALSFFLLLGAFIYVGIYTLWLKPRTFLNIVIGGAAGSAAVMSGGAAVGAWQDPAVIVLAALVFLWTPAHFWSLAILYRSDYQKAGTPMLPAQISLRHAAFWVLIHTLPTALSALLLGLTPALGPLYLIPVTIVTIDIIRHNIRLLWQPNPIHARKLFISSNIYLMVVLLAICLDTTLSF
ncbi:MAG TPA: heme o synthase [Anaerolineae bacterium]|nr:heme o synthase [Anaerolineae bacterium]